MTSETPNDRVDGKPGDGAWAEAPFSLLGLERMFATPVLTFSITNAAQLNRRLIEDIEVARAASPGVQISNQLGWHSEPDLFQRQEASFRYLCQCLGRLVLAATREVAPRLDLDAYRLQVSGWINVNGKGAYNTPHDHAGHTWSGCYYVKVPAQADGPGADLEFLDPRTNVKAGGVPESPFFANTVRVSPREGDVLLFPSYVRHWVYPNHADEQRISIAFNARLVERTAQG